MRCEGHLGLSLSYESRALARPLPVLHLISKKNDHHELKKNLVWGKSNFYDGNELMTQQRVCPALAECESPSNNLSQLYCQKRSQVVFSISIPLNVPE